MVFWSSFSKKIKQAVSQISFDALKRRVETIESDYATKTYADQQNQAQDNKIAANTTNIASNTSNITNNTNNINTLDTKVDGVISGLQNGNIVNYAGEYNSSTNYKLAQAVTYGGDWFVSKQNNNQGHTPTKTNNAYWVYISAPTVDLTPYLTIDRAVSTYATITTVNGLDRRLLTAEQTLSTNSTNIVNLENTKASTNYVDDRTIIKYWAPFPAATVNSGSYKFLRINNLPRSLNFINAQVQEGITENSDYQHNNIGEVGIKVDIQYSYNSGACFAYIRNNTNRNITIGGQYDDIGSLALYFTRTIVRGSSITITT